jgi:hypothetical protein
MEMKFEKFALFWGSPLLCVMQNGSATSGCQISSRATLCLVKCDNKQARRSLIVATRIEVAATVRHACMLPSSHASYASGGQHAGARMEYPVRCISILHT